MGRTRLRGISGPVATIPATGTGTVEICDDSSVVKSSTRTGRGCGCEIGGATAGIVMRNGARNGERRSEFPNGLEAGAGIDNAILAARRVTSFGRRLPAWSIFDSHWRISDHVVIAVAHMAHATNAADDDVGIECSAGAECGIWDRASVRAVRVASPGVSTHRVS